MPETPFALNTARLRLRHFRPSDSEALAAVFGDAQVMRYGDGVQSAAWIKAWINARMERYAAGPSPAVYAVTTRLEDRALGYCGLFFFPDVDGRLEIEIGYRLARAAWGQGYATEAARAVRDEAFAALGLRRLIALIDPDHRASIRVAEKIGMHHEKDVMMEGYTHPDRVYVISIP